MSLLNNSSPAFEHLLCPGMWISDPVFRVVLNCGDTASICYGLYTCSPEEMIDGITFRAAMWSQQMNFSLNEIEAVLHGPEGSCSYRYNQATLLFEEID